ncbi:hypothetical protein DFJ73DRAFT_566986 [Zopfochytrium polystomum]|nr:hypothetical protein DFJ73DRAFT_566986 [Zopfochytrium polystomum]
MDLKVGEHPLSIFSLIFGSLASASRRHGHGGPATVHEDRTSTFQDMEPVTSMPRASEQAEMKRSRHILKSSKIRAPTISRSASASARCHKAESRRTNMRTVSGNRFHVSNGGSRHPYPFRRAQELCSYVACFEATNVKSVLANLQGQDLALPVLTLAAATASRGSMPRPPGYYTCPFTAVPRWRQGSLPRRIHLGPVAKSGQHSQRVFPTAFYSPSRADHR